MWKSQEEKIAYLEKQLQEKDEKIAELKQQNFYLESIIAWMPGHVYWLDKNNVYLGCNDLHAKNAGLNSRHEIVGKTNFDLKWKNQAVSLNATNTKILTSGTPEILEELGETPNGERLFLTHKVPLKNNQGEIIGLIGISIDITERIQMEKDLKASKEQAESASHVKTEFLKNMSHDLRTPFSGILGFTKILMKQEEDENKRKKIKYIMEASESLVKLLNEIIEMSDIEQRSFTVNNINFNLRNLIAELISLVTASVKYKNLELLLDYPQNLPADFCGDKIKLHRILLNLIGNAIRFTEKGYVRIKVTCNKKSATDVELNVAVEDTGVGIADDKYQAIFEQFTRLNSGYKDLYSGTGLGLYIAKKFVSELGGDIAVSSEIGVGSTFTCRIPLRLQSNI